jgi:hypothetical protein
MKKYVPTSIYTVRDMEFRALLSMYCQKSKIGFTLLTSILPFATILIDMNRK